MDEVLVAVISGGLTLMGVAIPIITSAVQGNAKDKRDRQERAELERQRSLREQRLLLRERRKESAMLLRMARDFRVAVEDSYESRGAERAALARRIRQRAADISGQADEIGMLVPELNAAAELVAEAARDLVAIVTDEQSMSLGAPTQRPDTGVLARRAGEFKSGAMYLFQNGTSPFPGEISALEDSLAPGELQGELAVRG
jgi:hypothetical protein